MAKTSHLSRVMIMQTTKPHAACARNLGGNLAIFIVVCLHQEKGWKFGHIHCCVFAPGEGVEIWPYSLLCVCTRRRGGNLATFIVVCLHQRRVEVWPYPLLCACTGRRGGDLHVLLAGLRQIFNITLCSTHVLLD